MHSLGVDVVRVTIDWREVEPRLASAAPEVGAAPPRGNLCFAGHGQGGAASCGRLPPEAAVFQARRPALARGSSRLGRNRPRLQALPIGMLAWVSLQVSTPEAAIDAARRAAELDRNDVW